MEKGKLRRYYELDLQKLETLLLAKGWPASEIADRGVYSRRRVNQITNGNTRVFAKGLKRLADLFDVKPEELIKPGPYGNWKEPDKSKVTTFDAILSDTPENFEETSTIIHNFITNVIGYSGFVVDFDEESGKVKINFELNIRALKDVLYKLQSLDQCIPRGDPRGVKQGADYSIDMFWWIEEIRFPDDCPYEPLRGFSLKRGRDFYREQVS